jgi:hypothetical protein
MIYLFFIKSSVILGCVNCKGDNEDIWQKEECRHGYLGRKRN